MRNGILSSRLHNCLNTILELEAELEQTCLGPALQSEYKVLKEVVKRLENIHVEEEDVCRIEAATGRFLEELKETLEDSARKSAPVCESGQTNVSVLSAKVLQ